MRFGDSPHAGGAGQGQGREGSAAPLPDAAETSKIPRTDTRQGQGSSANPEAVPEPYRDAVKRFLTH
jgi:hypothetical protein